MSDAPTCHNGPRCPGWNGQHAEPGTDPYCPACLDRAARDIRALLYDYLDLAQLHEPSLSQAPAEHTGGSREKPIPISAHVEALQAEIVHTTTTWEYEVRVACGLPDPTTLAPLADWHTTLTRPTPAARVRPGAAVQRAVTILTTRVDRLAKLPATTVCPAGVEDQPADMTGTDAIQHLQDLHRRARSVLGRTRRIVHMPGSCPGRQGSDCGGELFRADPQDQYDPCDVYCGTCGNTWPYEDYSGYVGAMLALPQPAVAA